MPMPRVIGISFFACLVTSACVTAKSGENNTSGYSGITPSKAKMSTRGSLGSPCGATYNTVNAGSAREQTEGRGLRLRVAADGCRDASGLCCGQMPAIDDSQYGEAAWYDLVGRKTASGEILDSCTATAANRSLPLDSFAKVTDLDNGRSVIVKINDRGPYTRGRVIDLSPRAAEALHMKAAGVAAVIVEPMANQVDPVVDAVRTTGTELAP
jgi:rare lipoprotein A